MTKQEWSDLASALAESWQQSGAHVPATETLSAEPAAVTAAEPRTGQTVEQIVQSVVRTVTETVSREAENQTPSKALTAEKSSSGQSSGGSGGSDVLKTIGMVTGIGPIGTALVKLFGGGGGSDSAADLPAPVKYTMPPSLDVTAGLTQSRSLTQISYAQGDRVRADEPAGPGVRQAASTASTPSIQIQVNAMDSRSFMDHSDEIAQAVRAAMLRSHALNDVVSEI